MCNSFGYNSVLDVFLVLLFQNIPDKFWICQGYTRRRIYLKISWISLDMSDYILICMNMAEYTWICLRQRLWIFNLLPSKHFDVVSSLFRGWYDVGTLDKAKSTLKQRCVHQHWHLQRWTISKQCCLFQRWLEKRSQYRNNVVSMTIKKNRINFEPRT